MTDVHCGIDRTEPRNAGVVAFLNAGDDIGPSGAVRALLRLAATDRKLAARLETLRSTDVAPRPPFDMALSDAQDPVNGLGTHPDLVDRLWTLNAVLPEDCRQLLRGAPTLTHPRSGVIFAFGLGTIGYALRIAAQDRAAAEALGMGRRARLAPTYDLTEAGLDWYWGLWRDEERNFVRTAHDAVGSSQGRSESAP